MSEGTIEAKPASHVTFIGTSAVLLLALLWFFAPAISEMHDRWSHDPRYSHGYLVPLFSIFLLWQRRAMLDQVKVGSALWGFLFLLIGIPLKIAGGFYGVQWIDAFALIPCVLGVIGLVGGKPALAWAWPSVAFLFFMIPLPYRLEVGVGGPLQWIATRSSNYALQTFGLPALTEGNIISIGESRINVVEACNGLGMLMMFIAYATAAALVIDRPPIDKVIVMLGAVPIAIFANVARITLTGLLHVTAGGEIADKVYHDLAGWLMMPLALAILWLELQILSRLFVTEEPLVDVAYATATANTGNMNMRRPR